MPLSSSMSLKLGGYTSTVMEKEGVVEVHINVRKVCVRFCDVFLQLIFFV